MKASFCASIVACTVALATGSPLQAQYEAAGAPFAPHGFEVGHSQPAYPAAGTYLQPAPPPGDLLWFRGEYLLWWFRDPDVPPLVTTGSPTDTPPGALGQPGTRVLFGDEIDYDSFNGARFTIGGWLDEHRTFGAEVNWFLFDRGTESFGAASPGSPILSRPFFDVSTGFPSSSAIATPLPLLRAGAIDISSSSRLLGFEINGLCDPWYDEPYGYLGGDLDLLYGFRYADLEEDLRINDANLALVDLGPGLPAGSQLRTFDLFDTRNRFYGGQAGLRWEGRRGPVTIRLVGKLALGATHQNVRVDGRTIRIDASGGAIFGHGKLAHGTNIGEYSRDQFSVIPEVGTYVGYDILEGLSIYAGYTFLYWTNVVRPGDQIDTGLNNSQRFGGTLVGEPRPAFDFHETDFWAHGLSLGASLTF